jgi:hypothetical protein
MTAIAERVMPELPSATRIGQGTAVEQSRAIAQVQAMVVVAQQCPRRVHACIKTMTEACQQIELAEKAFFRYPRGKDPDTGKTLYVSGPSVHLARELARCWGNVEHGITEMRRDDGYAQSEMQAYAWDLEANTRSASTFIVPHKRDTKAGVKDLTDMRDIYENNANNGARRLRESIFSVLPAWYQAQAVAICEQTLANGGGKPLAQRIADAVQAFERHGVTAPRMEAKFGRPMAEWTGHDVALLGTIYESIKQGTVTADQEFPDTPGRVTAAEITKPKDGKPAQQRRRGRAAPKDPSPAGEPPTPPADPAGEAQDEPDRPPAKASSGQLGILRGQLEKVGYNLGNPDDHQAALRVTGILAQADDLGDLKELDQDQAARATRWLRKCADGAALELMLAEGEVSDDD